MVILMRYSSLFVFWVKGALNDPDGSSLRKSSPFGPRILFSRSRARYPGPALPAAASINASSKVAAAKERNMIKDEWMVRLLEEVEVYSRQRGRAEVGRGRTALERDKQEECVGTRKICTN